MMDPLQVKLLYVHAAGKVFIFHDCTWRVWDRTLHVWQDNIQTGCFSTPFAMEVKAR